MQRHPVEDTETLAQLARQDPDPRVRKEAIRRIEAPRVLAALGTTAGDEAARRLARSKSESLLVKIAADDRDLEESRRALGLLGPLRALAEVVCRARFDAIRDEAFDRLTDVGDGEAAAAEQEAAFALVAARAGEPSLRRRALEAIRGDAALMQVATGAGAREIAQAAVRRIEDPEVLLGVAGNNAPKSVRRLAQRRAEERLPENHPERARAREKAVRALLERLEGGDPESVARSPQLFAEAETLAAAGPLDDGLLRRLAAVRARREDHEARAVNRESLFAPLPEAALRRPAAPAGGSPDPSVPPEYTELLARLEDPEEELSVSAVDDAEREAGRLLSEFAEDSETRVHLAAALREARSRAFDRKKRRAGEFELAEMADHAAALARSLKSEPEEVAVDAAQRELTRLVRRFEKRDPPKAAAPERERFESAVADAEALLAAAREARAERRRKARERFDALDRRLEALEASAPLPLEDAETALRDLGALRSDRAAWKAAGPEAAARFQRRQAALLPRLREAREEREWRHWSNLEGQAELIRQVRALLEVPEGTDDARVDRELTRLERSWREVRHTSRDRGQELWEEWGQVRGQLLLRVAPFREARERDFAERLEGLDAIAAQAETIADASDPSRAAEMRALMSDWRARAKGMGKRSEPVWKRFRAANDRYFEALQESRAKRLAELAANIPIREELIRRAKALLAEESAKASEEAVRSAVRELMHAWKEAPPIPRKRSDRLWEEFRSACDAARDRFRKTVDSETDREGGEPAPVEAERQTALRARIAEVAALPSAERPGAAAAAWSEYRKIQRDGNGDTGSERAGTALLACLREAFEEAPESFAGTRFDQEALAERLRGLLGSIEPLARRGDRAPREGGVAMFAEHLQRTFGQGRAADRDAEARGAARTARQILERARASGPALSEAAAASLTRIEQLVKEVISRAPPPPKQFPDEQKRRSPRRPFRSRQDGPRERPRRDRPAR